MKISVSAKEVIANKIPTINDPVFVIVEVDVPSCCSTRKELRPFLVEKKDLPPAFTYATFDLKKVDSDLNLPLYLQKGKEDCWENGEITTRTTFGNTRSLYFEYTRGGESTGCCN